MKKTSQKSEKKAINKEIKKKAPTKNTEPSNKKPARAKSRAKKPSFLTELKLKQLPDFLSLVNQYCRGSRYIVAKGALEYIQPHLNSTVQCIEKYAECESDRKIDVFISFYHLESLFAHRQKLNMFFYNVARRMQLGGYIVGVTLDGQAMLDHPEIECSELDHHQMMVGKKQKLCITFSTPFSVRGDQSLLVEWNSVEKLAHHYRFRLVQTAVENYVRLFVYQLAVPLFVSEHNTWCFYHYPDSATVES